MAATKSEFHGTIWAKLMTHERTHALLQPGDRVLIAVSGGSDSVCLADFLARLRERRRLEVRIAHFNHGLRASAKKDEEFVRALAAKLGVPVHLEALAVRRVAKSERRSLEDAGRALRYRALARLARRFKCNKVATGHHADDQAETVLLHLLRGTRPEGLAGILVRRPLAAKSEVVRPLLCLTRREVLEYLRYRKLGWLEDPTNRSRKFLRNWVRHDLLPKLDRKAPGIRERLARLAGAVRLRASPTPAKRADARPGRGRSKARRRLKPRAA